MILKQIRISIVVLGFFTVITGLLYPLTVTVLAQLVFHKQANGSLIVINGKVAGSELIGQPFGDPKYFWGRLSATSPFPCNAAASAGSNYGPLNPKLLETTRDRIKALRAADPENTAGIPIDLVTASSSGLDPHISVAAALYQVPRVARIRGLSRQVVETLVNGCTENRTFGFLGEPRVNVLKLNLTLDHLLPPAQEQ
jgi:potassium-transporting ATPase KdpC subunit